MAANCVYIGPLIGARKKVYDGYDLGYFLYNR